MKQLITEYIKTIRSDIEFREKLAKLEGYKPDTYNAGRLVGYKAELHTLQLLLDFCEDE